ncbi:hypothetical protein IHE44_0002142 [Lamprotornis superbus]|uniref:NADP-dependent oxidoreductase domain-containing protein n=4 Tax=Neoaves TaxID=3078114 RepID=A0A835NID4_9PASS|nr:hypothetical protein IHE44_0002142 [Lamprotornis superbus]
MQRNGEDRLISKQNTTTPNVVNAARAKFRTVAIIARSLGTFTPQHHISLKESTAKQTGMKYRYGHGLGLCSLAKPREVRAESVVPGAGDLGDFWRSDLGRAVLGCCGIFPAGWGWVCHPSAVPLSPQVAEQLMTIAYESGVNLFDTAEVYAAGKAEVILGNILKKKGWRRSSLVITTKLYWGGKAETERGLSRKHIIEGLKASLQRLQLEYVDVVFANRPDNNTPMEEIVRAMTHVINQGMAMYWGTSRWSAMEIMRRCPGVPCSTFPFPEVFLHVLVCPAAHFHFLKCFCMAFPLQEAYSVARQFNMIPPVCEQAEYHLFQREKVEVQLPELYHKIGVGAMTWSPLACGIISGKYGNGVPESSRASLKGWSSSVSLAATLQRAESGLGRAQVPVQGAEGVWGSSGGCWMLSPAARGSVLLLADVNPGWKSLTEKWRLQRALKMLFIAEMRFQQLGVRSQVETRNVIIFKQRQRPCEPMCVPDPCALFPAWCLRNEGVSSVLLGSSNPEQLIENLGAIQVLPKMTSHIVNEIDNILGNKPYSKKDYRS